MGANLAQLSVDFCVDLAQAGVCLPVEATQAHVEALLQAQPGITRPWGSIVAFPEELEATLDVERAEATEGGVDVVDSVHHEDRRRSFLLQLLGQELEPGLHFLEVDVSLGLVDEV